MVRDKTTNRSLTTSPSRETTYLPWQLCLACPTLLNYLGPKGKDAQVTVGMRPPVILLPSDGRDSDVRQQGVTLLCTQIAPLCYLVINPNQIRRNASSTRYPWLLRLNLSMIIIHIFYSFSRFLLRTFPCRAIVCDKYFVTSSWPSVVMGGRRSQLETR